MAHGIELHTPRLVLRTPPPAAAPAVVAYLTRNRAYLEPWSPSPPDGLYTVAFWEQRLVRNLDELRADRSARMFVFDRGTDEVIGVCNFSDIVRGAFHACHLGYSIAEDRQGKGLMTEAVRAGVDFAFAALRLHRVEANYIPTNERSGRLLRRLGFQVCGYARDYLFVGGAWRDHILTALTNPAMTGAPDRKPPVLP